MKFLIMQSSPASCDFLSPRSKYSPQHSQSMLSPLCEDQVSHPHKRTGKIMVPYILIFMLLQSRWEAKRPGCGMFHLVPFLPYFLGPS